MPREMRTGASDDKRFKNNLGNCGQILQKC